MRGRKTALVPQLTSEEQRQIDHLIRSTTAPAGVVRRARAVLLVSQGQSLVQTAQQVQMTVKHVGKWCQRFLKAPPGHRLEALLDRKGRGRKPRFSPCGPDDRREDRLRAAGSLRQVAVPLGL